MTDTAQAMLDEARNAAAEVLTTDEYDPEEISRIILGLVADIESYKSLAAQTPDAGLSQAHDEIRRLRADIERLDSLLTSVHAANMRQAAEIEERDRRIAVFDEQLRGMGSLQLEVQLEVGKLRAQLAQAREALRTVLKQCWLRPETFRQIEAALDEHDSR